MCSSDLLKAKLSEASVSRIQIERAANRCRITIHTARPGVVIGRKGAEIDKIKEELSKVTGKEVYVDIQEVKQPEIDAQLVAENITRAQFEHAVAVLIGKAPAEVSIERAPPPPVIPTLAPDTPSTLLEQIGRAHV